MPPHHDPHPKQDLFETVRNRISIILIKIDMHIKDCPMEEQEKFWLGLHLDLDTLIDLIKEKRSSKRLKASGPTFIQSIFFGLFMIIFTLLGILIYQVFDNHKDINTKRQSSITSK